MYTIKPEQFTEIHPRMLPLPALAAMAEHAHGFGFVNDISRALTVPDIDDGPAIYGGVVERIDNTTGLVVADVVEDGTIAGLGLVGLRKPTEDPYFKDRPTVLSIENMHDFQGQGLGRRRYLAMNAASLLIHGLPIHSWHQHPDYRSDAATRRWEKFVAEGLAESYTEISPSGAQYQRFRFK